MAEALTYLSDDDLGKIPKYFSDSELDSQVIPTPKKVQYLSDTDLGSPPAPQLPATPHQGLIPKDDKPGYLKNEEEFFRPRIEAQKEQFKQELDRGYFKAPLNESGEIQVNEQGAPIEEASPALKEAGGLLLPPYRGLRGVAEAGGHLISQLPHAVGQGVGAITGGLYGAVTGKDTLENAIKGTQLGAQGASQLFPASAMTEEGIRKVAQFEVLFEEATKSGGAFLSSALTKAPNAMANPIMATLFGLFKSLPREMQIRYEAAMDALGQGAVAISPMLGGGGRGKPAPSLKDGIAKLEELEKIKVEKEKAVPLDVTEFRQNYPDSLPKRFEKADDFRNQPRDPAPIPYSRAPYEDLSGMEQRPPRQVEDIPRQEYRDFKKEYKTSGSGIFDIETHADRPVSPSRLERAQATDETARYESPLPDKGLRDAPFEQTPFDTASADPLGVKAPPLTLAKKGDPVNPPVERAFEGGGDQSTLHSFSPLNLLKRKGEKLSERVLLLDRQFQEKRDSLSSQLNGPLRIEDRKNIRQAIETINTQHRDALEHIAAQRGLIQYQEALTTPGKYSPDIFAKIKENAEWARGYLNKKRGGPDVESGQVIIFPQRGKGTLDIRSFNPLTAFEPVAERIKTRILPNGNPITLQISGNQFDYKAPGPFRSDGTREGLNLVHEKFSPGDFVVTAKDSNGNVIGYVEFGNKRNGWLEARNVEVVDTWRDNKIMTAMYDYAKDQGYKIRRSPYQTEDGRMAWNERGVAWSGGPLSKLFKSETGRDLGREGFEKKLVEEYGEQIRPYAEVLYAAAKKEKREAGDGRVERSPSRQDVLQTEKTEGVPKYGTRDTRTGDEFKAELLKPETELRDIDNNRLDKIMRIYDQGQTYARNHAMLHWAYSKMDWSERGVNREVNSILYGENFVDKSFNPFSPSGMRISSLRHAIRDADPNSMMYGFNKLPEKSQEKVIRAANEFNGVKEPDGRDLRMQGLNVQEIEAYQNLRKGHDKFWDEYMVPMAEKLGIELPPKVPGYFPMSWFGDYRVWGKNKNTGKMDFAYGVDSIGDANTAIKDLSKRFPEYEFKSENTTNIHKEFNSTPDAFLDAIRLFGRNSTEGKVLYDAMQEITMRMGASRHRLARNPERTQGYAGSLEEGKSYVPGRDFGKSKQVTNFIKANERYIETGVRYTKNREMIADMDKVLKDPQVREKFPNVVDLTENMRASYLGQAKFIDKALDKAMIELGVSTNLPRNILSGIAGMVMYTAVMGLRLPFYAAQALQGVFTLPRLAQMKGKGMDGSITEATLKGTIDWLDGSKRVEDIRWAVEYGIVDPKFAEQITFIPKIRGRKADLKDTLNLFTGNRASAGIDQTVRLHSYLTFLNFAESAGIKGKAAREFAAHQSLDVMVEYESWKRAPMFREMETLGSAFSPLTTFTNNLLNRLTEYTKDMGKGKAAPLATIAGIYLFLSGLYGFPFRQDADNAIDLINKGFGLELTGPTDFLIKNADTLGDTAMFGVPSGLTGWQVGGSLGSPEIVGSLVPALGDPVPKKIADVATGAWNMATKGPTGTLTDSEAMQAQKSMAFTAPMHGMIENFHSPDNKPRELSGMLPQDRPVTVPDATMRGSVTRSPAEQVGRLFGMRSVDETKDQISRYRMEAKETRMESRRTRATDLIVDGIIKGDSVNQKAVSQYVGNGGDPEKLITTVEKEVMDRMMDYKTRTAKSFLEGDMDSAKFRKMKLLEEFKMSLSRRH